ncbi:MAG: hypothetical protein ABMB14_37330, partial [Myxococcota bacterium]
MPSDRRAERRRGDDPASARDQKKTEDQEEVAEQAPETTQARDAAQDALGNQGVAEMLGVSAPRPGEAGFASDARSARTESQGPQLGGDDVPDDGPLTLDDLVRSWNPTTRKGQDTDADALDPLEELPPEDEALLARVADAAPPASPPTPGPDRALQPSRAV